MRLANLLRSGHFRFSIFVAIITAAVIIASESEGQTPDLDGDSWESPLLGDHPLVGRIWDVEAGRFIEQDALLEAIGNARYLLLGEKHDNPDHHRIQALLIDELLATDNVNSVSFEMMTSASSPALNAIQQADWQTLDSLKTYLSWDEEGWEWEFYGPLIRAVLEANVEIKAANISSEQMMSVYQNSADIQAFQTVLSPSAIEQLNEQIDSSHCGMLPESQFPPMVRVQQARDFEMARALIGERARGIDILVAGNFHVRKDLGVPNYLREADSTVSAAQVVSLAALEVEEDVTSPAEYATGLNAEPAYDYLWFTPVISDEDYCAAMR